MHMPEQDEKVFGGRQGGACETRMTRGGGYVCLMHMSEQIMKG